MNMIELCNMLEIPEEVQKMLIECENTINFDAVKQDMDMIKRPEPKEWEKALAHMKELLGSDEDGMKILTCQLHCVCDTYDEYVKLGISKEIFVDTMKFFTRFLQDHKDRHGSYRYVWAWWVPRQISMVEFRIGALEYEMKMENDKPLVDIHIPAATDMSSGNLRKSYLDALDFFKRYYPNFAKADMVCCSWMLAPSLKYVLSEDSKIIKFQRAFDIGNSEENHLGFMDWVYGSRDIPIDELPELTSLQRKLKSYLQGGGTMEWTFGKLKADPFK